jgi:glycosyltransferase involved in cell wall biosynthesis
MKILFVSNFSKAVTGFGKNMKNVLRALHEDPRFEVVEAANGCLYGADLRTPWKSYGTFPSNPSVRQKIEANPHEKRMAEYGNHTIDDIVYAEKPDIIVGIEDIWAFDWAKRKWFNEIPVVIWTTLDSSPVLQQAYDLAPKVDKFLVWASFAEKEMKKNGVDNVETIHGAIDLSHFHPLEDEKRQKLRERHGIDDFLVGFVFKNQLRKSVPNLLEGFKQFQEKNPNAKLLLHTDWVVSDNTWDIPRYIKEKGLHPASVLATYLCEGCKRYQLLPYTGEKIRCSCCGGEDTLVTKSNMFGVTEHELNEIYNMMDVYCHPFTSGGQELPVQEAKAAGLTTLVTEYSCGTDCCYENMGGLPLKWVEYREPYTQFIKATTLPESICEQLQRVKDFTEEEKQIMKNRSLNWVGLNFSVKRTVEKLTSIFEEFGKCEWDFNREDKYYDSDFEPDSALHDTEWVQSLYKGIFDKDFDDSHVEVKESLQVIQREGRDKLHEYLKAAARQKNAEKKGRETSLEDLLDGKKQDRIAVVLPESAGDVLMCNSLLSNLKKLYPKKDIYFFTNPMFFPMVNANPAIHKLIPYKEGLDNLLLLEGQGKHSGYFDMAFLPHVGCQRILNYLHNGKQQHQFSLR